MKNLLILQKVGSNSTARNGSHIQEEFEKREFNWELISVSAASSTVIIEAEIEASILVIKHIIKSPYKS